NLSGNSIECLGVALAVDRHHEWDLVHFERSVDVVGMPANIADFQDRVSGQFTLNSQVPLMIPAGTVSRIDLVSGVRLRLIGARKTRRAGDQRRSGRRR